MKKCILLLLLLCTGVYSQNLHHQMLSAQGTSKVLPNGVFVSQTIGQQSVTGNYTSNAKTYGQGFQQSTWNKRISKNVSNLITTTTYPNPFVSKINFQFSQPIKETILISIFDVRGRLVYTQEKKASENILSVDLPNLASTNYLVKLTIPNYTYYAQILKQ